MTPSPGRYVPDGPLDEGHIDRVPKAMFDDSRLGSRLGIESFLWRCGRRLRYLSVNREVERAVAGRVPDTLLA